MTKRDLLLLIILFFCSCEEEKNCDGEIELWGVCYSIENTVLLDLKDKGLNGSIPIEIGELIF